MVIAGAAAFSGLLVPQPRLELTLLEASAVVALLLVWQSASSKMAKWIYLAIVLYSGIAVVSGVFLVERGSANWARALIISGFFVKLAIFPVFVWLLRLADDLPSVVLGLVISVVDIAAFGELWLTVQNAPWIATPAALWLGVAVLTALTGSLLMLAQRDLKRLLVLSTIEDLGFLLLGTASLSQLGISGALVGAVVHALAKALLFICLSAPEAGGDLKPDSVGLTRLYPVSGGGFVFGLLAMLGIPPTLGFIARWKLYETALLGGPWVLALFVMSSMFALIAYTLALTRFWWGPGAAESKPRTEPALLRVTIIVLVVLLLAGGFWPNALHALTRGIR
jgi:multicomponent Na+:H+ antiporter subunit D